MNRIRVKLPASLVRNRTLGSSDIEEYAQEIISLIEEDIENALERRENNCTTEIGANFDVSYMKNADAQREIYYLVMKSLIEAGYYPKIYIHGRKAERQKVFMITNWNSRKDRELVSYKDKFLRQNTVKKSSKPVVLKNTKKKTGVKKKENWI